jgi:hypothetical protein
LLDPLAAISQVFRIGSSAMDKLLHPDLLRDIYDRDPDWKLIYVGLTLVQVSSSIFLAGVFGGSTAIIAIMMLFPGLSEKAFVLPHFVGLASLFLSFIGACLCWNVPSDTSLRIFVRPFVVFVVISGMAVAGGRCLPIDFAGDPNLFDLIAYLGAYLCQILWGKFLLGLAHQMREKDLELVVRSFALATFFGLFFWFPSIFARGKIEDFLCPVVITFPVFLFHIFVLRDIRRALRERMKGNMIKPGFQDIDAIRR